MKTIKKSVKTDGKIIGEIEVPQYDNVAEAVKGLTEATALSKLNRQVASDFMNEFRASQTRDISPINKLQKMAKTNPELQTKIDALVAKYGVVDTAAGGTSKPTGGDRK